MNKENLNPTNQTTSNPLDDYIQDIKSRNNKKSDNQQIEENAISYDDLYNKLLKETHNLRSEILTKNKMNSTNFKPNFREEKDIDYTKEKNDNSYGQDAASLLFSRNINRALIFQSTENMNKDSKNDNNENNDNKSELLSPIVKMPDEQKSGFNTLNKLCNGTESKNLNSNVKFKKENLLQNNLVNNQTTTNVNLQNTNAKNLKRVNDKFSSKKDMINTNNITGTIYKTSNPSSTPLEEFQILYLINNCKEIEKIIETNKPIEKIEKIEDKISKNFKNVDAIKKDELEIVEMKQEMELKLQEVRNLCKLYTDKLTNLEEYINKIHKEECSKCKMRIIDEQASRNLNKNLNLEENDDEYFNENYTFDNYFKNKSNKNHLQIREEKKILNNIRNKIISELSLEFIHNKGNDFNENNYYNLPKYLINDKFKEEENTSNSTGNEKIIIHSDNSNHINMNNPNNNKIFEIINYSIDKLNDNQQIDNISNDKYTLINSSNYFNKTEKILQAKEISEKINFFLSNGQIKEATENWKKINFAPLENSTFERSYEMLAQIIKKKERDNESLNKRISSLEREVDETRKKDIEIVQLFAEMELYRNIAHQYEANSKELDRVKNKLNDLISDNSLLYKENVRLKFLLKEAEYHNMKTNSQTLFSTNNSINLDIYNSNNLKSKYFL